MTTLKRTGLTHSILLLGLIVLGVWCSHLHRHLIQLDQEIGALKERIAIPLTAVEAVIAEAEGAAEGERFAREAEGAEQMRRRSKVVNNQQIYAHLDDFKAQLGRSPRDDKDLIIWHLGEPDGVQAEFWDFMREDGRVLRIHFYETGGKYPEQKILKIETLEHTGNP